MKRILLGLFLILVLSGCSNQEVGETKESTEDKEIVSEVKEHNSEVKEFIEKSFDVDNYKYAYSSSILNPNKLYYAEPTYDVYIKEDNIRKSYLSPVKIDRAYYSDIYLIGFEKALGVCSEVVLVCKGGEEAVSLNYDEHKLKMTPLDLIQNIPNDALVVGLETFDNRKAKIFEYYLEGKKVRLSVDIYSGLTLKKLVYGFEDDDEVVLEKHYFRDLAVGNVRNADVSWE
jgi:hypothetical protein